MGSNRRAAGGELLGTIVPTNSQLTLNLDAALVERHLSLRDCVAHQVYARGHGRTANELDLSPSRLTEKLAGTDSAGKPRGFTLDELERYLQKTGDQTPVLYLVAKYLRDPAATRADALGKLAQLAESLPALLAAAGIEPRGR